MPINRIKKWAKERGLSQTQVAALAGTQQGRVSEWYTMQHPLSRFANR